MQASLELGNEIEHASKWPGPLTWSETTLHQRARSMKLFATVKSSFASHDSSMRFSEGISLASSNVDMNSDQHVTRVAVEKHTTDVLRMSVKSSASSAISTAISKNCPERSKGSA